MTLPPLLACRPGDAVLTRSLRGERLTKHRLIDNQQVSNRPAWTCEGGLGGPAEQREQAAGKHQFVTQLVKRGI